MKHPLFNYETNELIDLNNIHIIEENFISFLKTDIQDKLIKIMDIEDFMFISTDYCFVYDKNDEHYATHRFNYSNEFKNEVLVRLDKIRPTIKFKTKEHMILAKLALNI